MWLRLLYEWMFVLFLGADALIIYASVAHWEFNAFASFVCLIFSMIMIGEVWIAAKEGVLKGTANKLRLAIETLILAVGNGGWVYFSRHAGRGLQDAEFMLSACAAIGGSFIAAARLGAWAHRRALRLEVNREFDHAFNNQ